MKYLDEIKDIYPFKEKYCLLKSGHKYHYVDEGTGETIVMLHGNPSWSFLFRNLIIALSKHYRVIAPDHLGFGLSDKPQKFPYRLETHIDNLDEFLEGFKLKKITLLMHDWGGPIGFGYAERYPENIKRLIITNTAAFTIDKMPLRLKICRMPLIGEFLIKNLNIFAKFATVMTTVKPMEKRIKDAYLMPFLATESRCGIFTFVKDIPMWPEDASYELLVQLEHCLWVFRGHPVCLIWGMKDWCFKKSFFRRWCEYYPEAECHKLENAGHFLYEDEPDKIINIVSDFMKKPIVETNL